jgi:hypothetical protein
MMNSYPMPGWPASSIIRKMDNFTGFIAYYPDGDPVREMTDFFDPSLGKICATNWHYVDQDKLCKLEAWWQGKLKITLSKDQGIKSWIFNHSGSIDSASNTTKIISRRYGYHKNLQIFEVEINEETGDVLSRVEQF